MNKLKDDIKVEWLAALRGTEYQQGRGLLRSEDNRFCCLGVLCDLAVKAGIVEWDSDPTQGWHIGSHNKVLPFEVIHWAFQPETADKGLSGYSLAVENPIVRMEYGSTSLAVLNDSGKSFKDIATYIEEQL